MNGTQLPALVCELGVGRKRALPGLEPIAVDA